MGFIWRIIVSLLLCCLVTNALLSRQKLQLLGNAGPFQSPPGSNSLGLFFVFGDTNNDLHLDEAELVTLFAADIYQRQGHVIAYVLLQFDADGDNKLNETELQAALSLSENEFLNRMA